MTRRPKRRSSGRGTALALLIAAFAIDPAVAKPDGPPSQPSLDRSEQTVGAIMDCLATLNGQPGSWDCGADGMPRFEAGRHEPARYSRESFESLGRLLNRPEAQNLKLRIAGHADCSEKLAKDPYLGRLTLRRAARVRALLVRFGHVRSRRFDIVGRGASESFEQAGGSGRPACSTAIGREKDRRVSLSIVSPLGARLGGFADGQFATAFAGNDPAPRDNRAPVRANIAAVEAIARAQVYEAENARLGAMSRDDRIALGDRADAAAREAVREADATLRAAAPPARASRRQSASYAIIRYFPQGIQPAPYFTVDLSQAAPWLRPRVTGTAAATCAQVASGWIKLDQLSLLDRDAGSLVVRLRGVLEAGRIRPDRDARAALLLDIRGTDPATLRAGDTATAPGYWALRERLSVFLRAVIADGRAPEEIPVPDALKRAIAQNCLLPAAHQSQEVGGERPIEQAISAVLAAAPATSEDILARRFDFSGFGFVRLEAGMQLCVTPAEPMVGYGKIIEFRLGPGGDRCAVLRHFAFDSGRVGLTIDSNAVARFRDSATLTELPTVRIDTDGGQGPSVEDNEQLIVTRLTDLVDPARSSSLYLIGPRAELPASSRAPWTTGADNAAFLLGLRSPEPVPDRDFAQLLLNQFLSNAGEACRWTGADLTLPDDSIFRVPAEYWQAGDSLPQLQAEAQPWWGRCATAERAAELSARLPVLFGGTRSYVAIGTSWAELGSIQGAPLPVLFQAARQSLAITMLFGNRRDVTLTAAAAGRLPLLSGDSAPW